MTKWKTIAATPSPATTPGSRAAKSAAPRASAGIVAALVRSSSSGPPGRSSSIARVIAAWIAGGSSPASVSSVSSASGSSLQRGAGDAHRGDPVGGRGRLEPERGGAVGHGRVEVAGEPLVVARREVVAPVRAAGLLAQRGGIGERGADGQQVGGLPRLEVDHVALGGAELVEARRPPRRGRRRCGARPTREVITSWSSARTVPETRPAVRVVGRRVGPRPELAGQHRGDPPGEHQPLEQRVGGQPVGAVDPGAGDLAGGVEAGYVAASLEVGAHAAGGVVAGRGDRDQVGHRVDAVGAGGGQDRGEPALPQLGAEVARVQPHVRVAGLVHPAGDRLGDHVARRQVGELVHALHEPVALEVDEERALAAHGLGDQRLLAQRSRRRGTSRSGGTARTPGRAASPRPAARAPSRRRWRPRGSWSGRRPGRARRWRAPPPGTARRRRRRARPRRSRAGSPRPPRRPRRAAGRRRARAGPPRCRARWRPPRSARAGSPRRWRRRRRARSGRGGGRPRGSARSRRRRRGRSWCPARSARAPRRDPPSPARVRRRGRTHRRRRRGCRPRAARGCPPGRSRPRCRPAPTGWSRRRARPW